MPSEKPNVSLSCLFDKAILSRKCGCRYEQRERIDGRRVVACCSESGHANCLEAISQIRKGSNFVLGSASVPSALKNIQAKSLQCGGLLGLQNALDDQHQRERVDDICTLIQRALRRYGSVERFPMQQIVRKIASLTNQNPALKGGK